MAQTMIFDLTKFFDGFFTDGMLEEHPVDSAHDGLHNENVNTIIQKSGRKYIILDDKLKKDHDNLFIEVLKQEYPLLYESIEYFHQLRYVE